MFEVCAFVFIFLIRVAQKIVRLSMIFIYYVITYDVIPLLKLENQVYHLLISV